MEELAIWQLLFSIEVTVHAEWIEKTAKIVFSTILEKVEWNNSRLVKVAVEEEIKNLKQQPGKDMVILGSPRLAHYLMQLDLIDEYKITVSPVRFWSNRPRLPDG